MTRERWETVLALLNEVAAPARITVPIIMEISQQLRPQPQPQDGNGNAVEMPHVPH